MEEEEARLQQERGQEGTWYHEGSMELRNARIWIAQYSLPNAKERLKRAHEEETSVKATARAAVRQELQRRLGSTAVVASQVGGARPLTYCSFSSDSQMLATASWSGLCNIWSAPSCEAFHSLRGHTCQVGSIVFRPQAKLPPHFKNRNAPVEEEAKVCSLASCGYDGSVLLWNLARFLFFIIKYYLLILHHYCIYCLNIISAKNQSENFPAIHRPGYLELPSIRPVVI